METSRLCTPGARRVQPLVAGPAAGAGPTFRIQDLPPFPAIATRLLGLLAQPEVGMKALSDLITTDAAMATEVLRMANSMEWGLRSEVTSLLHALALLGVDRVKGLAFTVAIRSYLSRALHYPSLRACWRHNLACALMCDELSRQLHFDEPQAYTAGLLHDIGRLALCAAFTEKCARLFEDTNQDHSKPLEIERKEFGIDHCALGLRLARQWSLPVIFHAPIAEHHNEIVSGSGTGRFSLKALVQLSCLLSDHLGFASTPHHPPADLAKIIESLPEYELGRLLCDWQGMQFRIALRINALDPGFAS